MAVISLILGTKSKINGWLLIKNLVFRIHTLWVNGLIFDKLSIKKRNYHKKGRKTLVFGGFIAFEGRRSASKRDRPPLFTD
ncbi:MAG: hypothetical protein A2Z06_01325 [Candidatus Glassbacteria bacterium RBG_16_58_8]|uniref:Uncharacterized protein n=1 Tax=Candidatus Glassbacteria bacterium RBG_16_58_8 TaxID=1817866 RepID=A0A1F5YBU7_9BACT|nr:MAG: hypothetical protein A2Z06_01325 [Candidatus Glassbacteria bacterium RBG_16_58_8]